MYELMAARYAGIVSYDKVSELIKTILEDQTYSLGNVNVCFLHSQGQSRVKVELPIEVHASGQNNKKPRVFCRVWEKASANVLEVESSFDHDPRGNHHVA